MPHDHPGPPSAAHLEPGYRSALKLCAVLNLAMFFVEGAVGLLAGSAALVADAADFLEDAGVYALGVAAVAWSAANRARVGLFMGLAMGAVGLVAVWQVVGRLMQGGAPAAPPMLAAAAVALAVNVFCATRLARHKRGDASMRSIWLSTRNDALLNVLTIAAAALVWATANAWPDLAAGVVIAAVNLWAAQEVIRQALREMRAAAGGPS